MNDGVIKNAWLDEPIDQLLHRLQTQPAGLTDSEAEVRKSTSQSNLFDRAPAGNWQLLRSQFESPMTILLIVTASLAFILKDTVDAVVILVIVLASSLLGFWQERTAARTIAMLLGLIKIDTSVIRSGIARRVLSQDVVVGDILDLSAGSSIPADCRIIDAKDLHVDEAALTGETFPVEKLPGTLSPSTAISQRSNALFLGTHVVSGTGRAVAVTVGSRTEFGRISDHLKNRTPETEFERGLRRFGYLLMQFTMALVGMVFVVNLVLEKPAVDSLLFALALAVGMTPQLLPAVIAVNLAYGAKKMAQKQVIVRHLTSIENFGSMDVLCCDKTGTLTEGIIRLKACVDPHGTPSDLVRRLAFINSSFETGLSNPIDDAIRSSNQLNISDWVKLDEVPYDFTRRRLSILVAQSGRHLLITKGAAANTFAICDSIQLADGSRQPIADERERIEKQFEQLSQTGSRVLGVACRDVGMQTCVDRNDETNMTFIGFLTLEDLPKADCQKMILALEERGVSLKIVTGDNHWVAASVAKSVGLCPNSLMTGAELRTKSNHELIQCVSSIDIFAEVEPNQKESIITALQAAGHVVGYLGDGINDATALHVADVGISVDSAVDVAKSAADIVLMRHDLSVLIDGIEAGRRTFANTVKYVFMAISGNFGGMFSMAGASLILPFLPLLPRQILFVNLMTDLPAIAIATDTVDDEDLLIPRRWNIRFIRNFMIVFGLLSSVFDYATFAVLIWLLHADVDSFRTGWLVESIISATLIVLIIRTKRISLKSRPSLALLMATLVVVGATIVLPISPLAGLLGLTPLSPVFAAALCTIIVLYVALAEVTKSCFYSSQLSRPKFRPIDQSTRPFPCGLVRE